MDAARISPDGARIAYTSFDASLNKMQIWVVDPARGVKTRLTNGPSENTNPVWSPDGSRLAFGTNRVHQSDVYVRLASAAGPEEPLVDAPGGPQPDDWSRDGRYLSFVSYIEGDRLRIPALSLQPLVPRGRPIEIVRGSPSTNVLGMSRFSPDGRWLAYSNDEGGTPEVFVTSVPEHDTTVQISSGGGLLPTWRGDGRELFYVATGGRMMAVDVAPGTKLVAGAPHALFSFNPARAVGNFGIYDVSSDGQRFLVLVPASRNASAPLDLVLDWAGLVEKR
jgi:Tol biopolymer transport system component